MVAYHSAQNVCCFRECHFFLALHSRSFYDQNYSDNTCLQMVAMVTTLVNMYRDMLRGEVKN